jgi:hypothetical protein
LLRLTENQPFRNSNLKSLGQAYHGLKKEKPSLNTSLFSMYKAKALKVGKKGKTKVEDVVITTP